MSGPSHVHRLVTGMVLVAEPMPWLRSAAFTLLLPAGTCYETEGRQGLGGITVEMSQRGAGERDSRQIVEALDFMGVERTCGVSTFHTSFSVAAVAEMLDETLEIYAAIARQPHLPDDELEESRQAAMQELLSIEDDPSHKVFTELKKLRYGNAHGRSPHGSVDGIEAVTLDDVRAFHKKCYVPNGAILAVAGRFEWNLLKKHVDQLFGDWEPSEIDDLRHVVVRPGQQHLPHESSQTHIALAYDCVPYQHPEFYQSRGLISVLSDGMSSRLFTEVRESAASSTVFRPAARRSASAEVSSPTPVPLDHGAQETLDVTIETIHRWEKGSVKVNYRASRPE